ncbi:MAG: two-component system, OmpR family, sensor kinase [Gaiellaceae bacterium]|nr:two-component system, OmpR family, sensor kinase [Gaiellaceae bacterium]
MRQLGLRRRLLLVVATAVAVAICALVVVFDLVLDHALMRDANTLVRTRAATELTTLQVSRKGIQESETPDDATPATGIWVFSNGRAIETARAGPTVQAAARAAATRSYRYTDVQAVDLRLYAAPVVVHGRRVGTVVAATSLGPYEESRRTALIGSLVFAAVVLGLVVAAAWWLLSHALQPVVRMTRQAAAWSERDLDKRFALGEPTDELTELAATLDGLLDRLATTLRHEQRFSAELSHELRTPLARLIGEAELALRRRRDPEEYRSALELIHRNARALSRTVDALVAAARNELGAATGSADAYTVAADAAEACTTLAEERQLAIQVEQPSRPLRIGIDHDFAERILQPVIENACRYGRSSVLVSIAQADGTVAYSIEDDGPGVDNDEREAIFEPGSRGRAGDDTSGAGLGLALARRLARSVAGDVTAVEARERGSFRIILPRG